jgi:nitrate reductase NapE
MRGALTTATWTPGQGVAILEPTPRSGSVYPAIRPLQHHRAPEKAETANMSVEPRSDTKAQEFRAFVLLAVVMAPVLAVVVVSGFGFLVWMFQLIAGPPGAKL